VAITALDFLEGRFAPLLDAAEFFDVFIVTVLHAILQ
jgi:hypothetical protein